MDDAPRNPGPPVVGSSVIPAVTLPDEAEAQRRHAIAQTAGLEVFAPVELERVEGSGELLAFVGSGPDAGSLWVQGTSHDAGFYGRQNVRVVFEGDPPTPRHLVRASEVVGNYPATLEEWEARRARRAASVERSQREAEAQRERLRASAAAVTFDILERDGVELTLREAGEAVRTAGGTIRVHDSRLLVALAPSALRTLGQPSVALKAARRLYVAEGEVVACAKRGGEIDVRKLPDKAILPSGSLEP
jgi:hypothetical protein